MPVSVSLEIVGLERLERNLNRMPRAFLKRAAEELDAILINAQGFMFSRYIRSGGGKTARRLISRRGDLRRSIGHKIRLGLKLVAEFGSYGLPYSAIHEFGGVIRAKRAPFLRFQTQDGEWHSVKRVRIPKRPYIRPTVEKYVIPEFMKALNRIIKETAKQI